MDGILLIDKPAGYTSHDMVDTVRRRLRMRRVGHAGTLDPFATGLLIVLVGRATRFSQQMMDLGKRYTGTALLGQATNTQDTEGHVVFEADYSHITPEQVREAFGRFTGEIRQTPPMFSAVKVGGQRLYDLARRGIETPRESRPVTVYRFDLTRFAPPEIDFDLECSRGTYVRTLINDIGSHLGCGAYLIGLRRTGIGPMRVDQAVSPDALTAMSDEEIIGHLIADPQPAG